MKNLLFIFGLWMGCASESAEPPSETITDWALQSGTLKFRTPDVYGDDDAPKPEPSVCFVARSATEVWVAEVIDISDVIIPNVDCESNEPQIQVTHQVVTLMRSNNEQAEVVVEESGPHDQLIPGQRVLMGVVPANDVWLGLSYLLIDGPGQQPATPGMPADFQVLREKLKSPGCEPAFSTDAFVASIFEPSESPCDISQPATTEIHEVTDNDL